MDLSRLRQLGSNEQVALLFAALFGLLLLATAALALRAFVRDDSEGQPREQRLWRDLRAVWLGALLFWVSWVSGPVGATLAFGLLSFFALREFITLAHTRRADHRSLIGAFFVVLPLQYVIVGLQRFDLFSVFIPVYVFAALPVLSALGGDPARFLERNAKIQWGIMVCVFGLSHAPALLLLDLPRWAGRGAFLLFFLVVTTAAAQIVQELASRRLRSRPTVRQIDRSFSWRAWGLGLLGAALVGGLLFWTTPVKPLTAAVMGALAGGSGTLGDLVMRALKKDAGVRWWGNRSSVTGAVGLLDRVAPLCFAAPVFFHSVRWYF
ncbi:phosphatidate cytidylyltransferase [Pseudorhodoferax sp.]|uniref:phosphatidate cytidylyltransferase n=1 Tax=Pseudorhodoferax sp. TaxID=1993553 RepID=UPI002DD6A525|nr:phosphatidate cytidylyltransferase [Pseudorhodoferax sp.]